MDLRKANMVLRAVAKCNGTTVEEVIKEIEAGIDEAIDDAIKKNNIDVLNKWKRIPCVGSRPTAAELVACLGERLFDEGIDCSEDLYLS